MKRTGKQTLTALLELFLQWQKVQDFPFDLNADEGLSFSLLIMSEGLIMSDYGGRPALPCLKKPYLEQGKEVIDPLAFHPLKSLQVVSVADWRELMVVADRVKGTPNLPPAPLPAICG